MSTPARVEEVQSPSDTAGWRRGGLRQVAHLAYPVVLQNLSVTTLHMVDAAFLGRVGPTEMGAAGYGGLWIWTALCFFLGTGTGVQTFVAQAHGAGRERQCGPWAWQALAAVLPPLVLATALFAWAFPALLTLLAPAVELQGLSTEYVRARALGCVGVATTMVLGAFFRGLGDMRTPLLVTMTAALANVVLDWGLIFGNLGLPALGVRGAGLATAIAEWLGAALLLACFLRGRVRRAFATVPVRPRLQVIRRFVRTGAPIGGMWFLDMITFSLFTTLIARMGSDAMAASQAFVVLLHVSFMQVIGFQIAAMTLVGRYIGADDHDAAERSYRSAMLLGVGYAGVVGLLFLLIPGPLLRIFTSDARVLELGLPLLAVGALFQLCDAVGIIANGALRGAGDTRWPFLVQTAMAWGLFLPLGWLGGVALDGGLVGAWLGGTAYFTALGIAMTWRFRSGAWKRVRI
jgi:MATE family multidrug resistance protein